MRVFFKSEEGTTVKKLLMRSNGALDEEKVSTTKVPGNCWSPENPRNFTSVPMGKSCPWYYF